MTTVPFGVHRFGMALLLATATAAIAPSVSLSQTFQYPPYGSVRGRMVARDGIFHSTRYRWGNGLTSEGAATITGLANVIVPALPGILAGVTGREFDEQTQDAQRRSLPTRTPMQFTAPADYVEEQRRANDLLARTAALVGAAPGTTGGNGNPPSDVGMDKLPIDELLKRYGALNSNPWKP